MKCGGCCAGLWVCGLGCFGSFQVERLGLELERVQFAAKAEAARLQSGFRAQGFDCTSSNSFHPVLARHKTGTSRTSCGGLPFMLTCWVLCRTASLQLSSEVAGVGIDGAVFGPRDQGFLELLSVWCWNALDKAQACQAEATAAKDEVPCALDSP